ncbi:hypothetical protein P8452_20037 [Trifolium repens]|nr:hypothetical protein P8452_20037 [Trifolium repens]
MKHKGLGWIGLVVIVESTTGNYEWGLRFRKRRKPHTVLPPLRSLLSTLFYLPLTTSYRSISSKFLVNLNYQNPKLAGKWHLLQTHG